MINYNNHNITGISYNNHSIRYVYGCGGNLVWSGGTGPTPPVGEFKFLARYEDSHTESAECDSRNIIANNEIKKTNLVSVEIGNCVTRIGSNALSDAQSLTSVTIPDNVVIISDGAFSFCYSLTGVTIPSGVTEIGASAFIYSTGMTQITCLATTPPALENKFVFDNTNNSDIYVLDESLNLYKNTLNWSQYSSRIKPLSEKP